MKENYVLRNRGGKKSHPIWRPNLEYFCHLSLHCVQGKKIFLNQLPVQLPTPNLQQQILKTCSLCLLEKFADS